VFQLDESDRTVRDQLKKRLAWLGFGSLTSSTWLAPNDRRQQARRLREEFGSATIDILEIRSEGVENDRDLAARCWDLVALDEDYVRFIDEHVELAVSFRDLTGPAALAARTELVSTYRHFPFRDPSIPVALRPVDWAGARAHAMFLASHASLAPAAIEYVESVIGARVDTADLVRENI
jgi:phenylacetic acid degradation operon negative regulatory protein